MNVIEANHKAFLGNIELKISEVLVTKGDLVLVGELGNLKDKLNGIRKRARQLTRESAGVLTQQEEHAPVREAECDRDQGLMMRSCDLDYVFHDEDPIERSSPYSVVSAPAYRGGEGRKRVKYHPPLMNWAIAFLARTSARVYAEVAKVMMLLYISHIYRETAKLVSTQRDKAFGLHMNTIRSIHQHSCRENWTLHQRIGVVVQDLANINATIEHKYVSNLIKGVDQTHCLATLSRVLHEKMMSEKQA